MEIVAETANAVDVKAKGNVSKLPKVKKAIIGRADVNAYGTVRNGHKGEMVGSKYQILVILAEDFNGIKAGERTTANAVLYKMGVKTLPFFTDFEKAKAACKRVSKWGKEERVVTPRKVKAVSAKDISIENLSEEEKKALIARLMAA
jgi:hypothetical protein